MNCFSFVDVCGWVCVCVCVLSGQLYQRWFKSLALISSHWVSNSSFAPQIASLFSLTELSVIVCSNSEKCKASGWQQFPSHTRSHSFTFISTCWFSLALFHLLIPLTSPMLLSFNVFSLLSCLYICLIQPLKKREGFGGELTHLLLHPEVSC